MTTLVTPTAAERWRFALAVFAVTLALFVASLAPTVTLWDAGEFLAASRIVGIPHPPGTPLWVILAHTWGTLVPIGEWAYRINLMTAVASAVGAACFGWPESTIRSSPKNAAVRAIAPRLWVLATPSITSSSGMRVRAASTAAGSKPGIALGRETATMPPCRAVPATRSSSARGSIR